MLHCIQVGELATNCYIYKAQASLTVVIDPGDDAAIIEAVLHEHGVIPDMILLTHGHLDHSNASLEIIEWSTKSGRTIPILIGKQDIHYTGTDALEHHVRLFNHLGLDGATFLSNRFKTIPQALPLPENGQRVPGTSLVVLPSPGHTLGSVCFYDKDAGLLFSGDTLFRSGIGRTDLPDSDPDRMITSLQTLFQLPENTKVLPGHGRETRISREKQNQI